MTAPMELVRRLDELHTILCAQKKHAGIKNGDGNSSDWEPSDRVCNLPKEAAACIREMVEWRPIETAPRDGRFVVAMMGDAQDRWEHLNGRAFVVRHEGTTDSGYNLGWSVYPGFGGVSDQWFSGWLPLPPAPGAEA